MRKPGLIHMRKRSDFLRAQKGIRRSAKGLLIEVCLTPDNRVVPGCCRVGFTASRKVGNAVARNRAKRRLRAAAAEILSDLGQERIDYVLIARGQTLLRPYDLLLSDLAAMVGSAHHALRSAQGKS